MICKKDDFQSGAQYIRAMFANMNEEGGVTLEREVGEPFIYYMDWTKEEMEAIVADYEKLEAALTQLGKEHGYWERSTRDMPADLLEIWNTYVAPFPENDFDEEQLEEIWEKNSLGEELTQEEKELDRRYIDWFEEVSLQRLPYKRCSSLFLMNHARRYEKLVSLHAPKVVVDREALYLAEEFAMYHGGLEVA